MGSTPQAFHPPKTSHVEVFRKKDIVFVIPKAIQIGSKMCFETLGAGPGWTSSCPARRFLVDSSKTVPLFVGGAVGIRLEFF